MARRRRIAPPNPAIVAERYRLACATPPVQPAIWKRVLADAKSRKVKAARGCTGEECDLVQQERKRDAVTPVEQIACNSYLYWEHRAWMDSSAYSEYPLDKAARERWIAAGGKKPRGIFGFARLRQPHVVKVK